MVAPEALARVSVPAPKSQLVAAPPELVAIRPVLFTRSLPPLKVETPVVCQDWVEVLLIVACAPAERPAKLTRPFSRPSLLTTTLPPVPLMAKSP